MNDDVAANGGSVEVTPKSASRRNVEDAFIITRGATANQLSQMFNMNIRTVQDTMTANAVPIVGQKNGGSLYKIKDAAPHLVPKIAPDNLWFAAMKKTDLPPAMRKDFWDAAKARQTYEENAGELWRTEAVQQLLGAIFKEASMAVRMIADNVERDVGLTPQQRQRVIAHSDMMLLEMKDAIIDSMGSIEIDKQKATLDD